MQSLRQSRNCPLPQNRRGLSWTLKPYSPSGLASHCRGPGSLGCIEVTCPPFGCPWHATYRASGSSVGVSPGSGGENLQRVQGSRHCGSHQLSTPRECTGVRHECHECTAHLRAPSANISTSNSTAQSLSVYITYLLQTAERCSATELIGCPPWVL